MAQMSAAFLPLLVGLASFFIASAPCKADPAGDQWRALEKQASAPLTLTNLDEQYAIWSKAYEIAKNFGDKDLRLATTCMRLGMYQVSKTAMDLSARVRAGAPYQIMLSGLGEAEDQALNYYQKALAIRLKSLGPDNPDVAYCYVMIGGVYQYKQDNETARQNYQKSLDTYEKCFGPEGEDLVSPLMQLAGLYIISNPSLGAQYYSRVVDIEEKHLPPDSPRLSGLLTVLGAFKQQQRRYSDAAQLYKRALSIRNKQPYYERPPDNTPEYLAYCNRLLRKPREQSPGEGATAPTTPSTLSVPTKTPRLPPNSDQSQARPQPGPPFQPPPQREETIQPRPGTTYTLDGKPVSFKTYQACLLTQHGNELMDKNNNAQAAELFRKAVALDPKYPTAQCELGLSLLRNGKPDDATAYLKEAARLDPTMFPAWCGLIGDYKATGKLEQAIATMKECEKRFPSQSNEFKFDSGIHLIQKELDGRALVPQSQVLTTDYYSDAIRETKAVWQNDRMPIRVYIRDGYGLKGFGKNFPDIFRSCLDTWVGATNGRLSVKYVPEAEGADIDIVWADDPNKLNEAAEGGDAKTAFSQDGIQKVTISLLTIGQPNNSPVTDDQMKFVCYHEIGHSLGIHGHSRDPHDVMYFSEPLRVTAPNLSPRDLKTLAKIYGNK